MVGVRGFSILETMVALGLLAFITLSIMALFLSARTMGSKGEGSVLAANLADSELDSWKAKGFASIEALEAAPESYERIYHGQTYEVEATAVRLSSTPGDPGHGVFHLTVTLEWEEKKQLADPGKKLLSVGQTTSRLEVESLVSEVAAL